MKFLLLAALTIAPLAAQETAAIAKLTWLAGSYKGTMNSAQVEEHWLPAAGGAMLGMGRTVAQDRMVEFEFLRIEQRGSDVYYVAQPQGRPGTDFKLTSSTATKAVFENPSHDFPRVITYEKDTTGNLTATLEGEKKGKKQRLVIRMKQSPK